MLAWVAEERSIDSGKAELLSTDRAALVFDWIAPPFLFEMSA